MKPVLLMVNGEERRVTASPEQPLLGVLRDYLQLTGTKYGCGEGQCGACTVLVGGKPVRSCLTPLSVAAGKTVVTIEGLANNGTLHTVQEAFLREEAFQCGYCVPGMILSAVALISNNKNPSVVSRIILCNGVLCRE